MLSYISQAAVWWLDWLENRQATDPRPPRLAVQHAEAMGACCALESAPKQARDSKDIKGSATDCRPHYSYHPWQNRCACEIAGQHWPDVNAEAAKSSSSTSRPTTPKSAGHLQLSPSCLGSHLLMPSFELKQMLVSACSASRVRHGRRAKPRRWVERTCLSIYGAFSTLMTPQGWQ